MPDPAFHPASASVPLTPLQQGMYFTWLQNPAAGVDVEQMVCTLPEAIDAPRLRAAWETLTATHPILRTTFTAEAATVHESLPFSWQELAATPLPDFLETDRATPLDLNHGPLQRLTLIQQAEGNFTLVWTFHHILIDGRAITALLREVFQQYDSPTAPRPPAVPSFEAHNHWQATLDHTGSADFWKAHLSGLTGPTPLVVDGLGIGPEPRSQDETDLHLPETLTNKLRALADAAGVTLNTCIQAAFALLIGRYAGEDRVVFGATRACRHTAVPDSEKIAGLLINTLPIKADLPASEPILTLFQTLRRHWLDLRPHEHSPLSFIRRAAGLSTTQPAFNHLLVFENDDYTNTLRATGGPAFARRTFDLRELTSVPLTLAVYGSRSLRLHCAFQPAIFSRDTIQRLLGHMAELLLQFTTRPLTTPLSAFTLLTPPERQFLVHDWQPKNPGINSNTTLDSWFSETVRRHPDNVAVIAGDTAWTYAELERRANHIAQALRRAGVETGQFVGICMDRRAPLIAALLGILKAGAAYLPIDLAYPPERLAFMLEDAQAPVLLTERGLLEKIPPNAATVLCVEDIPFDGPASAPAAGHDADSLAYLIYTSGSTGLPKGCRITHRNVVRLMKATEPWFGFHAADVWTLFHSTAFDFSVWELWGALLYGGRLVVVPWLTTRSPDEFFKLICEEKVTILNQTPSAFRQLIQAEPLARANFPHLPSQSLRRVIFGGEALEMQSLKPWFDRHGDTSPVLVNMYGITETTVHVTYRPLSARDLERGSVIGVPIPDLQLYILDPGNQQPVPIGVPGEMYVGGDGLAAGYLHRPELTADRFIPNHLTGQGRLYKTGDLARFLEGSTGVPPVSFDPEASSASKLRGNLETHGRDARAPFFGDLKGSVDIEYLGRIDHQVKIRGFRIELGEIENILTSHPGIHESAVLAREDRPGDKRLCAWLVPANPAAPPSADDLRALLKTRVPDYMVPAAFVFLAAFPITPNGKLDRKALPAPAPDTAASHRPWQAPATPAEQTLASIWASVLRLDRISATDHFFEIGGDSILSIQVIARAREAGLSLSPRQLFEHPTLTSLAAVAGTLPAAHSKPTASPEQDTDAFPLTPIQRWFFDQNLAESHHWNQSFVLALTAPHSTVTADHLERALQQLVQRHAALRLRFKLCQDENRTAAWIPSIAPTETHDLLTVHPSQTNLEADCAQLQTTLDYQNGPLLRAAFFPAPADAAGPAKLCLAIHHLAIDGVSWRILLEDLEWILTNQPLPAPTASWPQWARQISRWPFTPEARESLEYWAQIPAIPAVPATLERDAFTRTVTLDADATADLLNRAPAAYRTRINDLLLTALVLAHHAVSDKKNPDAKPPVLSLHLEGHGREEVLAPGLPVDRTIGWFTALFPVHLDVPSADAAVAIPLIKEYLRAIPGNGVGYQFTPGFQQKAAARGLVFNYLGQFDALLAGSQVFSFAEDSTGPWHSPRATRAHATEINAMVIRGCLETTFASAAPVHTSESLTTLADAFLHALRQVIDHCLTLPAPRGTPSDFPLARLPQEKLDELMQSLGKDAGDVEDILTLSPMQRLFHQAALTKPGAGFDQWSCRIRGPLDVAAVQSAWAAVVQRHTILRSTFHGAGLPHAVMVVHRRAVPEFVVEDDSGPDAITRFLTIDSARLNELVKAPCGRFTVLRLAPEDHFFCWSVPDLQLDGWSWPIVFGEAAALYRSLTGGKENQLPPPRPYRDFLTWRARLPEGESDAFWQSTLTGFQTPTPVPVDSLPGPRAARRTAESRARLEPETAALLTTAARRLGITPGVLAQAAWAAILSHAAGAPDVVHGSAFSGRPTDLPGADRIVGPFVNNLPVRSHVDSSQSAGTFLRAVHSHLTDLAAQQFTPLPRIQDCSAVPWRFRLFDSILVFQNYQIDPALTQLGPRTELGGFNGPIHTSFPLTLVVTPSGGEWELLLVHQESACSVSRARTILADFALLLESFARAPEAALSTHFAKLSLPAGCSPVAPPAATVALNAKAPVTPMEQRLAAIWQRAFGLAFIGATDNFFDLGGHSLLMLRVHAAICQELNRALPITALFQYPTIAALAAWLAPAVTPATSVPTPSQPHGAPSPNAVQSRAHAARAAAQRAAAARR